LKQRVVGVAVGVLVALVAAVVAVVAVGVLVGTVETVGTGVVGVVAAVAGVAGVVAAVAGVSDCIVVAGVVVALVETVGTGGVVVGDGSVAVVVAVDFGSVVVERSCYRDSDWFAANSLSCHLVRKRTKLLCPRDSD